jgi:flagellar protein FlaG
MNIGSSSLNTVAVEQDISQTGRNERAAETEKNAFKPQEEIQSKAAAQEAKEVPEEQVVAMVDTLNEYMDELQTDLGFSIHDKTNQVIVSVTNRKTDELIRQIPAEELVTIREKMAELTGLILNKVV